jgi:hypothetical protein
MLVPLMWELVVQELQRLWHGKVVQCKTYSHITSLVWFEEVSGFLPTLQFPCILFYHDVCLMCTFFSDRNMLVLEGEHNFDATWVSELQNNGSLVNQLVFLLSSFILALVWYDPLCWTVGQVCIVNYAIRYLTYSPGWLEKIPEKLGIVPDSMKNTK